MAGRFLLLALPALALAACSAEEEEGATVPPPTDFGDEMIACALAGGEDFSSECRVQRLGEPGARQLVIWNPDGGFRRFNVLTDGRGLAVADGADAAETALVSGMLEVRVANDRYRLPVTVDDDAAAE